MLELRQWKGMETDPHAGQIFAYVYTLEDAKFNTVTTAFDLFEFGIDAVREEERGGEGGGEGEEGGKGEKDNAKRGMFHCTISPDCTYT